MKRALRAVSERCGDGRRAFCFSAATSDSVRSPKSTEECMKAEKSESTNELCLELKYCERCGGLWLRPVGSGQMFCARCAGEMAEPPARPQELTYPKLPRGRRPLLDENEDGNLEARGVDTRINNTSVGGVM